MAMGLSIYSFAWTQWNDLFVCRTVSWSGWHNQSPFSFLGELLGERPKSQELLGSKDQDCYAQAVTI